MAKKEVKFNKKKYDKQHAKVFKPYKKMLNKVKLNMSDKELNQLV
jgi:hypothetical protein